MIILTKLNGNEFVLNADLIRYVERCPDTLITMTSGDSIMVRDTMEDVVKKAIVYQQEKSLFPKYSSATNSTYSATNATS